MSASGRSEFATELRQTGRGWKRDELRGQYPDWPDARLNAAFARIHLRACT